MSLIAPVIKDKNNEKDCNDNYRPLVSMFSKDFELCMSDRLLLLLHVDKLQFGFVPQVRLVKRYCLL